MFVQLDLHSFSIFKYARLLDLKFLFYYVLGLRFRACMRTHDYCMHMHTRSMHTSTTRLHTQALCIRTHTHAQKP